MDYKKYLQKYILKPKVVFFLGTILALIVTYIFVSPEQCPDYYTQEQVSASGCIVGANIGLGFGILLACLVWAGTIYYTIKLQKESKPKAKTRK